jgi:WD40 repeat protein
VSGSSDNTLRLWDAVSGAQLNTLKGHSGAATFAPFSSDYPGAFSGLSDENPQQWAAIAGLPPYLNIFSTVS